MPGIGLVAIELAGSSAPYFCAIDARIVIALMPASLLTVHFPESSNHFPPDCSRMGLNWIMVHCAACIANLKPWRTNLSPSLTVIRLATSPSCSQFCGQSFAGIETDLP